MSKVLTDSSDAAVKSGRIHFLDEVRGLDILLMVVFHGFYTLGWLLDIPVGQELFLFFTPVEPFFAGLFIFICGISCYLSHSNWMRGLILLGISLVVSLVMAVFMPSQMIWFGILHLLAVLILLFALLRPVLEKIPPVVGLAVCAILLALCWHVRFDEGSFFGIPGVWTVDIPQSVVDNTWLYPLGLGKAPGDAADYFPLLPWVFCFLGGSFVGRWAKEGRFPAWMYRRRAGWLSWLGRHTLVIYVAHQPVIYGVGLAVQWVISLVS